MKKRMCDGAGIEVGAPVIVRERTRLRDGGFYSGVVVKVTGEGDDKDSIYILNDHGISITNRHCVYATYENLTKLVRELRDEIAKEDEKVRKYDETLNMLWGSSRKYYVGCPNCFINRVPDVETLNSYVNSTTRWNTVMGFMEESDKYAASLRDLLESAERILTGMKEPTKEINVSFTVKPEMYDEVYAYMKETFESPALESDAIISISVLG